MIASGPEPKRPPHILFDDLLFSFSDIIEDPGELND
jgi:hypothetical protein